MCNYCLLDDYEVASVAGVISSDGMGASGVTGYLGCRRAAVEYGESGDSIFPASNSLTTDLLGTAPTLSQYRILSTLHSIFFSSSPGRKFGS